MMPNHGECDSRGLTQNVALTILTCVAFGVDRLGLGEDGREMERGNGALVVHVGGGTRVLRSIASGSPIKMGICG